MKSLRVCERGHRYNKSSDCPVCPKCEAAQKPAAGFLGQLPAPARRALQNAGITNVGQLATMTEAQVLALHGVGPSSIPRLKSLLKAAGLRFS